MTYPDHYLLSWGGTICDGTEIWANNLRLWSDTPDWLSPTFDEAAALDQCYNDIRTLYINAGASISSDAKVNWVKLNRIGADGRYASTSESNTKFLSGSSIIAGAASAGTLYPPQVALAITFRTNRDRGPASRGRIYAPRPQLNMPTSGQVSSSTTQAVATAYATFITNLGNWDGIDTNNMAPAVVSGVGTGAAAYIRSVNVGSVLDTQRRRRTALTETRSSAAVPNPSGAP